MIRGCKSLILPALAAQSGLALTANFQSRTPPENLLLVEAEAIQKMGQDDLIDRLFDGLDHSKRGYLTSEDLLELYRMRGFEGSAKDLEDSTGAPSVIVRDLFERMEEETNTDVAQLRREIRIFADRNGHPLPELPEPAPEVKALA